MPVARVVELEPVVWAVTAVADVVLETAEPVGA